MKLYVPTHLLTYDFLLSIMFLGFLFATPTLAHGNAQVHDTAFEGYWATSNLTSVVEVNRCEDSLCAEIAWLWDVAVEGRKMTDEKNASQAKQKMPLIGLQLFSKFKKNGTDWQGRIYNPEDGRTYRATVTLYNKNILKLKGCWGPFCLTQYWRRLGSINLPTEIKLDLRK